jgi:hypothetical protein
MLWLKEPFDRFITVSNRRLTHCSIPRVKTIILRVRVGVATSTSRHYARDSLAIMMEVIMRRHREFVITIAWLAFAGHGLDDRSLDLPGRLTAINEVYIRQETGRIPLVLKPAISLGAQRKSTPELRGSGLGPAATSAPATCNSANASSQACYTATQQGHAK